MDHSRCLFEELLRRLMQTKHTVVFVLELAMSMAILVHARLKKGQSLVEGEEIVLTLNKL